MCEISDYPGLYSRAEWYLRIRGVSSLLPGYELLKRAIVILKIYGDKMNEAGLIREVEMIAPMEISKGEVVNTRSSIEQAMIEAVRSVSRDDEKITILEFVQDAVNHIF